MPNKCLTEEQLQGLLDIDLMESEQAVSGELEHLGACLVCKEKLQQISTARLPAIRSPHLLWNDETQSGAVPFASDQLEPGEVIGPYKLLELAGHGACGRVFQALDRKLDRIVAVKILNPETIAENSEMIGWEALATARCDHPGVVTVYSLESHLLPVQSESRGNAAINILVMQFVDGENLARLVANKSIDRKQLVGFIAQAAEGIEMAHRNGVIHRDVKPGNILVDSKRKVAKITDFGMAMLANAEVDSRKFYGGTPGFMAPELRQGDRPTVASDVYSLGVSLKESLAGLDPRADSDLDAVVAKATCDQPANRYSSMQVFADELNRWLQGKPTQARQRTPLQKFSYQLVERRAALSMIAGAIGLAGIWFWQARVGANRESSLQADLDLMLEVDLRELWEEYRKLKGTAKHHELIKERLVNIQASQAKQKGFASPEEELFSMLGEANVAVLGGEELKAIALYGKALQASADVAFDPERPYVYMILLRGLRKSAELQIQCANWNGSLGFLDEFESVAERMHPVDPLWNERLTYSELCATFLRFRAEVREGIEQSGDVNLESWQDEIERLSEIDFSKLQGSRNPYNNKHRIELRWRFALACFSANAVELGEASIKAAIAVPIDKKDVFVAINQFHEAEFEFARLARSNMARIELLDMALLANRHIIDLAESANKSIKLELARKRRVVLKELQSLR